MLLWMCTQKCMYIITHTHTHASIAKNQAEDTITRIQSSMGLHPVHLLVLYDVGGFDLMVIKCFEHSGALYLCPINIGQSDKVSGNSVFGPSKKNSFSDQQKVFPLQTVTRKIVRLLREGPLAAEPYKWIVSRTMAT